MMFHEAGLLNEIPTLKPFRHSCSRYGLYIYLLISKLQCGWQDSIHYDVLGQHQHSDIT